MSRDMRTHCTALFWAALVFCAGVTCAPCWAPPGTPGLCRFVDSRGLMLCRWCCTAAPPDTGPADGETMFFNFCFLQLLKASFLRHMNSMFSTSPCSYSSMTIQMGSTSMTPMRRTMWGWSRFFIKPAADRAESVTSGQSDVRIYQKKLPSVSIKNQQATMESLSLHQPDLHEQAEFQFDFALKTTVRLRQTTAFVFPAVWPQK